MNKKTAGIAISIVVTIVVLVALYFLYAALDRDKDTGQGSSMTVPAEITGEVIYIPFPVKITVDGDLSDWAGLPSYFVDRGPMLSTDPAEDGSFTFSVAADKNNFYITMQMPDRNIIAGQHGAEFWNEDSMEFYINASGNLNAETYGPKIFQININAGNIGNTDPKALTITGVNSVDAVVNGYVFKTENGWGFEASVSLKDVVRPAHGLEIGFQAQINGASIQDRDVKLIWSKADTADLSWQNPQLFGRAIFVELGRTGNWSGLARTRSHQTQKCIWLTSASSARWMPPVNRCCNRQ